MSTRASIIIKDSDSKVYFYRHSDGYPECTFEDLKGFCDMYKRGELRHNVSQSAGWLVVRGYLHNQEYYEQHPQFKEMSMWKVGDYEPSDGLMGWIDFLYVIDLANDTLSCYEVGAFDLVTEEDEKKVLEQKPIIIYKF